jgi:molybdate transport system permease protein
VGHVLARHAAALRAGYRRWRRARLCPLAGEFGATITFVSNIPGETQTLPLAIYAALQVPGGDAAVWRLALVAVVLSVVALVASELLARRQGGKGAHVL